MRRTRSPSAVPRRDFTISERVNITKGLHLIRALMSMAPFAIGACGGGDPQAAEAASAGRAGSPSSLAVVAARANAAPSPARLSYAGHDAHGIPHYAHLALDSADRAVLRTAFGIEDPSRLYESDSSRDGLLKYDTQDKSCRICYVNSYDVGYLSVRRPGESWEQAERRVKHTRPAAFATDRRTYSTSVDALDPSIQPMVRQMLADARRAGFTLRVSTTYRSPTQEAFLMAEGGRRTHTLTSMHSYGRALDILIGDGVTSDRRTKREWIAFRRWVSLYHGGTFRILGAPDRTWDWPHVEVPSPQLGFRSIDAALVAGRSCLAHGGPASAPPPACEFVPHLPSSDGATP